MNIKRRFMGTNELAEYIGVSINTVYYWVSTEQIPCYKIGASVKFDISEMEEWIKSKKRKCRYCP